MCFLFPLKLRVIECVYAVYRNEWEYTHRGSSDIFQFNKSIPLRNYGAAMTLPSMVLRSALFSDSEESGTRNTITRRIQRRACIGVSLGVSGRYVVTGGFVIFPGRSSRRGMDFPILINAHRENALRVMERSFHTLLAAASDGNFDVGITPRSCYYP